MYISKIFNMKNIFLMVLVCGFISLSAFSQQQAPTANPNVEITFDAIVRDFGTVQLNGLVEHEFTFTNTGKEDLIIQACNSSCGCTVPSCPRAPIKPGEKGTIKVQYTTTNVVGRFDRPFTVISNAKTPSVRLTIRGEIVEGQSTTTTP
jgi:hypothetical protein